MDPNPEQEEVPEFDLAQTELLCRSLIHYHASLETAAAEMAQQIEAQKAEVGLLAKTMQTLRNTIEGDQGL